MSRIRTLGVAALVMALAVTASSARAADETKKSDSAAIHGAVTAISTDKGDNGVIGTFTVKPTARKSKDAAAADAPAAESVTFKVTKDTTFAKTARKKKGDAAAPADEAATFADLKVDDVATVEAKDGVATSVKFRAPGKKKPAA